MAIHFSNASLGPLQQLTVSAPEGVLIGILGDAASGAGEALRMAAGLAQADSGEVSADTPARYLGPADGWTPGAPATLVVDQTLSVLDPLSRARAVVGLDRLRRAGASILVASHDAAFLERLADEIWWFDAGRLRAKGDPAEVVPAYLRHLAILWRQEGEGHLSALSPSLRRGDGRAELVSLITRNAAGQPASVYPSGEPMSVEVTVRFHAPVEDPVVGIMIRTRIGSEVYGTNTELEHLPLGPCEAGAERRVTFTFPCHLCPQEYTITAASHDPDGVWHDWMEDALAFSVSDVRYTAGVANLRARAVVETL